MTDLCPVCKVHQGSGLWDHMEKCRLEWAAKHPECPWSWSHGPDEPVVIGKTTVGRDEGGRPVTKNEEKIIRYADWEHRCPVCYPR